MTDQRKLKYSNQKEYLSFIQQFPRAAKPKLGRFYCFTYLFHLNPDYKKNPDKKKYLDFQPYDFCIALRPKKNLFQCINFHNFPVKTRQIFFARLIKEFEKKFENELTYLPGLNYKKLYKYLRKIGCAVRNYRFERVMMLREIPSKHFSDMNKFFPNFFYGSNPKTIFTRYDRYVPKPPV